MARDDFVSVKGVRGSIVRAGHHALEWCRGEPRRMLDGTLLPCDDWAPPDTPWHRDLRTRVIDRSGPAFGGPLA